jgi:dienelactone hydrolase
MAVKVWYPSGEKGNQAPYLENVDFAINNFNFPEIYRNLLTNSFMEVPISIAEKRFPVLIFSHGWGEHLSQNTILMEELASHGYVVFSLSHDFESKFTFYPDGHTVSINTNSERFIQIMSEQQNPGVMELYNEMFTVNSDKSRLEIFVKTSNLMPTLLKESPKYWAEDIEFFINKLPDINKSNSTLKTKLNLEQIGVFGMSMGGIAANEVCVENSKVKAGVNIDGGIYGSTIDTLMNTPFMFINSQRYLGYGQLFISKSSKDCYSVTVRNSDHYNFTDYALYPTQTNMMVGTVDAAIPIEFMNAMILTFFDKYLLGKNNRDLQKISSRYDVEYVSNIRNN